MAVFGIMTLNVIIHSIKTTQKDIQDLKIRKIKIEQFHFFVCTCLLYRSDAADEPRVV